MKPPNKTVWVGVLANLLSGASFGAKVSQPFKIRLVRKHNVESVQNDRCLSCIHDVLTQQTFSFMWKQYCVRNWIIKHQTKLINTRVSFRYQFIPYPWKDSCCEHARKRNYLLLFLWIGCVGSTLWSSTFSVSILLLDNILIDFRRDTHGTVVGFSWFAPVLANLFLEFHEPGERFFL